MCIFIGCTAKILSTEPTEIGRDNFQTFKQTLLKELSATIFEHDCGPRFKFESCWNTSEYHSQLDLIFPYPPYK